jgi:hypothetical protein
METVMETVLRTLRAHSALKVSTTLSEKSPSRTRCRKLMTSEAEGLSRRVSSSRSSQWRCHCPHA